jgi:hypothetical protein
MQEIAADGDPQAVTDLFENFFKHDPLSKQQYWPEYQQCIQRALKNTAAADPGKLVRHALGQVLAWDASLMHRLHHLVGTELDRLDQIAPQNQGNVPADVTEKWLPLIQKVHGEIRLTCRAFAHAEHTMQLAESRMREAENVIPFEDSRSSEQKTASDGSSSAAR